MADSEPDSGSNGGSLPDELPLSDSGQASPSLPYEIPFGPDSPGAASQDIDGLPEAILLSDDEPPAALAPARHGPADTAGQVASLVPQPRGAGRC